jgi:hypothetical protein
MSCNCIGNVYINENGKSTLLTEYMCFDIIANNPFCCDNFNNSCLDRIYFDSSASTYIGCHGCPSSDAKCCQKIQIEANKLNPDQNSRCCENFDSYCTEAYETLKNSSGNFCSSSEDLLNFYTTTYSTDYRPCGFDDATAENCIKDLKCYEYNSEDCKDKIYEKLMDFSSPCHCTCLKQAGYVDECLKHVIFREPSCCHSWTAECDQIKEELSKTFGNPCTIATQDTNAIGLLVDPSTPNPTVINCGCTIKGLPTFEDIPCCFKTYCQALQQLYVDGVYTDGPYNCNDLGEFLNKILTSTDLNIPDCQPTDYPLAGGPPCPNSLCNGCDYLIPAGGGGWLFGFDNICPDQQCPKWPWGAIKGCNVRGVDATDSVLGTPPRNPPITGPIYPISHNHNDCAYQMASIIYSYGCQDIFNSVEEMQDFILNLAKRFANPEQEVEIQATNCTECCSICRYFGKESTECSGCVNTFNFITETPAINNDNYLVYEGQGITFIASPVRTPYLYYQLVSALGLPVIDKNDIDASGNGINGKPLGMTGLLGAVGDIVKFNLKMKSGDSFEGPEYFRVKLIEQTNPDGCAYGTFLSNAITVKETPTFTLSGVPFNCQVNEENFSLTITTTNFPAGTIYYRIIPIIGASSEDFGIPMSGSLSIVNGSATLNIPIVPDQITEGSGEKFRVEFSTTSSFDSIVATTNNSCPNGIQIIDTSVTPLNVTITASPTNPNEGTIVTFQIQANQAGTYYYTINSNGSPFVPGNDFIANTDPLADVNSSGSFNITVPNGTATIYKRINPDSLTESATESFFMEIRKDSTSGTILTTSSIITIIDSSGTPSYNISGPLTVVEGNNYTYNVVTTNSAFSTLHYRIVAVNNSTITTADFGIPLTGSFILSPSGTYNLLLPVLEGELEAPEESFKIELWSNGSYTGSALASTPTIKILDTTQDVSISQTSTLITEEQSVTFTVTTINIDEEILTYKIVSTSGNIVAGDFTPPSLTGTFNLTGSTTKTGNFTLTLANNFQYEGQEKFKVEIYKPSDTTPIITSNEITVVDADSTLSVSTSAISVVEGNSFNITVNYTNYPNSNVYYRLETAYGTAINSLDFSGGLNGAIPISASSTSATYTIQTLERDIYSGTRGFYVVVSNTPGGDGESTGIIQLIDANPDYIEIQVPVSVTEGNSFNFTVNGTNIPNGTILYYQIVGLSSSDIVGGSLTGNFNVVNNTATVTIDTVNNTAFEGPESFTIKIFTNSGLTIEVLESDSITLFDGTKVYGPLSPNSGNIVEGTSQSFSLATENIATGTTVYYKIISVSGPVTADDFSPATLTGSFNVGSSFNITLANNIASELNDVFKIQIYSDSSYQQLKYTSGNFTIKDAAPKYFIVADRNTVDEGGTVSFDVTTENVPDGTNLIYYITGDTDQFDFVPVGITGAITINSNFYNFSLGISADLSTETGGEQFQVVIKQNDAGPDLSDPTSPITISDTSVSYYTISPTSGSIIEGNSQSFTVTRVGAGSDGTFYYGITGIKGGQELQETDFVDGFVDSFSISSGSGSFTITTVQNDSLNRQFTVKVGSTNDPYNSVLVETGIFNITDLNADYTVIASTDTVVEGNGITFDIVALNVPNGTILQYAITSTNGVNSSDFVGGLNGTVTIQNQAASLFKQTIFNPVFEGQQSFSVKFYTTDPNNPEVVSQEINLVDALPEITQINPNGCINCGCVEGQVQEGETVSYTVNGTNIPNGSQYNAILQLYPGQNGFVSSDVSPSSQTITFNNNTASFNVSISTTGINQLYEGTDEYIVRIRQGTTIKKESGCFTIIDAPPSATITPSVSSLQEGQEIIFNISALNVPNNSQLTYEITGIQAEDLVDSQLSGSFVVTQSSNNYIGSFTKQIATDFITSENESLTLTISYEGIVLDDVTIPIIEDTQPPAYELSVNRQVLLGQHCELRVSFVTQNVSPGSKFRFKLLPAIGTTDINPENFTPSETIRDFGTDETGKISFSYKLTDFNDIFEFKIHVFSVVNGIESTEEVNISETLYSFGIGPISSSSTSSVLYFANGAGVIVPQGSSGEPEYACPDWHSDCNNFWLGGWDSDDPPEALYCASARCPSDGGDTQECEGSQVTWIYYPCGCVFEDGSGEIGTCVACQGQCVDNTTPTGTCLCEDCKLEFEDQIGDDGSFRCFNAFVTRLCPGVCSVEGPPPGCLCSTCDENPGYTTYTSTPEIFLAVHHVPYYRSQQEATDPECDNFCSNEFGSCLTCPPGGLEGSFSCMWRSATACGCVEGDTICKCYRGNPVSFVSYTRFFTRKFRYDPNGTDNTSIIVSDEEQNRYRSNNIKVLTRKGQDNCRACCNPDDCIASTGQAVYREGVAVGCAIQTADPFQNGTNCYGTIYQVDSFPTIITDKIRDSSIVYLSNIFAGVSSAYLGSQDFGDNEFPSLYSSPSSNLLAIDCVSAFGYAKCSNQGYIYGKPLPPEGISGITKSYDAPHKYELYTPECCELITGCAPQFGCQSQYGVGCSGFMTSECYSNADRYCIHSGCPLLADGERSKNPFVYYYQGVSAGDTGPSSEGGIQISDCFNIFDPSFGAPGTTYFDSFNDLDHSFLSYPYEPGGYPQRRMSPPQKTGTCFNKTASTQFEAVKFIAEISKYGSPARTEVIKYLKNVIRLNIDELVTDCFCSKMDWAYSIFEYPYTHEIPSPDFGRPYSCPKAKFIEETIARLTGNGDPLPVPFLALEGEDNPGAFSYHDPAQQYGSDDFAPPLPTTYSNSIFLIDIKDGGIKPEDFVFETLQVYNFTNFHDPNTGQHFPEIFRNPCNPCNSFYNIYQHNQTNFGFNIIGSGSDTKLEFLSFSKYNNYGDVRSDQDKPLVKINEKRTLVQQIQGGRIYNKDVCEFIQSVLFAGIEVLHLTEPSQSLYQQFASGFTGPLKRTELAKVWDAPFSPFNGPPFIEYAFQEARNFLYIWSDVGTDVYGVLIGKYSPFNVNLGISRKLIPTNTLNLPNCSIKVYDKNDNEVECNGINEIIMAGRCFSGPVISKEVWERMKVKWLNQFGVDIGPLSFGQWVQSVDNFDVVDPFSGFTLRRQFYIILKESLYDRPTGIPPYSEQIVHADEERYLEYTIEANENPYITLEDLKARIPFEKCYELPIIPTFDSINIPCFTGLCTNIVGASTPEQCLTVIAGFDNIDISCGNLGNLDNDDYETIATSVNGPSPCQAITADKVKDILEDICEVNPASNKCKFKYNNKLYSEK